jgi:hypothetical protein
LVDWVINQLALAEAKAKLDEAEWWDRLAVESVVFRDGMATERIANHKSEVSRLKAQATLINQREGHCGI